MKTFTVNLLIVVNQIVCRMYGQESLVLDKGKLEGALSPFDFSYDTDEVTYAKVFRNLVVAHGFQDGNKRTACLTIKAVAPLKCSDIELANMALDIAQGKYRNDIGDLPQRMFGTKEEELVEDIIPDNSKSVITAVIDNYGTTTEPYRGPSFIMPDGSYLDIKDVTNHSDVEYWLDQQGLSIKADYTRRSGSPTLRSLGCIRIDTPKYYIQLPYDNITSAQYSTLKDWIEFLFVECGAPFVEVMAQGTSPVRYRYEDDIDADYIVDRIRRYYITDHLYEAHEDLAEGPYLKEDAFGGATQVSNIGQHKRSSIDLMEEDEEDLELKHI